MLNRTDIQECVVLETCHRVEVFLAASDSNEAEAAKQVLKLWSIRTGVSLDIITKTIQIFKGREAIKHLFYLASGLESVILGEDQILGQVHSAWLIGKKQGTLKNVLEKAFLKAINTGRKIRNETRINEGAVSISSAAVDLASRELGDLTTRKALIIGAGAAGALAAESLKAHAISEIMVANRTYEKSVLLADKISGQAIPFENIISTISNVDMVITAVSVLQPLLMEKEIASLTEDFGDSKRLLMIDISQPRAIEESIGEIPGISLKTIDDLKQLVANSMKIREHEAEKSKDIISIELDNFERELSKLIAAPIITSICRMFEEIRKKELLRAIRKMGESDERKLVILDRFSRELTERIAQIPIEQLRLAALSDDSQMLSVAERIFQMKEKKS